MHASAETGRGVTAFLGIPAAVVLGLIGFGLIGLGVVLAVCAGRQP